MRTTFINDVCVVPYASFCVQCLLLLQRLGQISYHFDQMILEPCSTHQYLQYMLRDQLFLIDSKSVSFTDAIA